MKNGRHRARVRQRGVRKDADAVARRAAARLAAGGLGLACSRSLGLARTDPLSSLRLPYLYRRPCRHCWPVFCRRGATNRFTRMHVLSQARARAEEHACTPARTQACKPEMHTCTDGGRRKRTRMHAERLHKHKHTWSRWLFLNLRLPCSPRPTASLGCTYATRHAAQCWAQNRRRYRSRTPRARDASRENCPGQANIRDCVILFLGGALSRLQPGLGLGSVPRHRADYPERQAESGGI